MNNKSTSKKFIVAFLAVLLVIFGIGVYIAINNPKVDFSTNETGTEFSIYQLQPTKFKPVVIKTPESIRLSPGEYWASIKNNPDYSIAGFKFTVKKGLGQDIKLAPEYSQSYLLKKYKLDVENMNQTIATKYQPVISRYRYGVTPIGLFRIKNDSVESDLYYAASISKIVDNKVIGSDYRVIFKKQNNDWKQITEPELIISSVQYPAVPQVIANQINRQGY